MIRKLAEKMSRSASKKGLKPTTDWAGKIIVPRDVFDFGKAADPDIAQRRSVLEPRGKCIREKPFASDIVPEYNGFWAHKMYPFTDRTYDVFPLEIWETKNACVSGYDGGVVYEDGTFERSLMDFAPIGAPDSRFLRSGINMEVRFPAARRLEGDYFLGFNGGHTNYAHWLSDHLIILWAFATAPALSNATMIMPETAKGFVKPTLKLMGIADSRILWLGSELVEFSQLSYLSYISFGNIPNSYRDAIRLLHAGISQDTPVKQKPIYVSRRDAWSRRLLNEVELELALERLGFEIVIPGNLSFQGQIDVFSNASFVVGLHGAGLANLVFCKPETPVLEIFSEYSMQPQFWTLASLCGLDYGFTSGSSFELNDSNVDQNSNWESPFVVDIDRIVQLIQTKLPT